MHICSAYYTQYFTVLYYHYPEGDIALWIIDKIFRKDTCSAFGRRLRSEDRMGYGMCPQVDTYFRIFDG